MSKIPIEVRNSERMLLWWAAGWCLVWYSPRLVVPGRHYMRNIFLDSFHLIQKKRMFQDLLILHCMLLLHTP